MAEEFIVPKEPKLHWKMFLPIFRDNSLLAPKNGRSVHHLFWARNGIYHGLAALGVKPGENVLVPAYHCTSLVEPILRYGSEARFYDINIDLSPNFDDIEEKIDRKTRAILAIHYFGFPQPIRKFRELCQARGLYLIEDCAHVLNGSTQEGIPFGESGDISIFSWRKFLPIYDGGQLVINNSKMILSVPWEEGGFLLFLKIAKNTLERLFEDSTAGRRLSSMWKLFSILARHLGSLNSGGRKVLDVNSYEVEFDLNCVNLGMSGISKRILKRVDIAKVIERRQRNYNHLRDAVQSLKGVSLPYPTVPQNICPWVFPLLVHGVRDVQVTLRTRGIPATSWGGVIHLSLILEQFPSARFLYENLLFLPIHQSMEEKDLQAMIYILGEVLRQRLQVDEKGFDGSLSLSAVSGG
jgi:dTDP-4-amino-4,6-dideoxygalactose transaminase